MPTWWTTPQSGNLVSPYHNNSGLCWTVSAPVKGIAVPVERHGVLQTLICAPVVRPKRCPTSSNPALLPGWTVVCPSFTLLMMLLLLPGWPAMGLNRIRKKKWLSAFITWPWTNETVVSYVRGKIMEQFFISSSLSSKMMKSCKG